MAVIPKGREPANVKKRIDTLFPKLNEAYPDKVIVSLQRDHKKWDETAREISELLGYENKNDFLTAYGYQIKRSEDKGGRPTTTNPEEVIGELKKRYPDGAPFEKVDELKAANPDLAGKIKSLANRSNELFGMTFAKYLKSIGVLPAREDTGITAKARQKAYLMVSVEGESTRIPCNITTKTLREGDYIEMCKNNDDAKTIGVVSEICYYTEESELPCPVEKMRQYTRKLLKSEIKEIEATREKYIFCSVALLDHYDSLYYLSPFDDIEVGDVVEVPHSLYGLTTGVVEEVLRASEKTTPYPIKKTKKIASITVRIRDEGEKAAAVIEKTVAENETKDFIPSPVDSSLIAKYEQCTHFASAVFRGLETDVREALSSICSSSYNSFTYRIQLCEGFAQFECNSSFVPRIIKEFPNLKGVFFAEHWKENVVYLAYSESGYNTVTGYRFIGKCDFYSRDRWSMIHDPTEKEFSFDGGQYTFSEIEQWEKCNYAISGGTKQLAGKITIPSEPYQKKTTNGTYQIIKIIYPENEKFYTL